MSSTVPTPSPEPAVTGDGGKTRFTMGLILDVFDVLNRHGYTRHSDQATGAAVGVLMDLVETYEGKRP